jgi:hypothetical protein
MPITSSAPRRSISKAQKPLNVATSRQRMPSSEAGKGIRSTTGRVSSQPGVTTPGASSSVWYQSISSTSALNAALLASAVAIPANVPSPRRGRADSRTTTGVRPRRRW